jgi:hypothetical protein
MLPYYFVFALAMMASVLLGDNFITYYINKGKRPVFPTVTLLLVAVSFWTWFLYLANSPQPHSHAQDNLLIRSALGTNAANRIFPIHSVWHREKPPKSGRIIWAVFSPGDTVLVRWLENREIAERDGTTTNYGPGWACLDWTQGYPLDTPICWQMP